MDVLHFLQIKFSGGMNHEYCIFTGFFVYAELWEVVGQRQNADAQFSQALKYICRGTQTAMTKAFVLLKRSASRGFTEAQFAAGWCCEYGCGTKLSYRQAIRWYKRAENNVTSDVMSAFDPVGEAENARLRLYFECESYAAAVDALLDAQEREDSFMADYEAAVGGDATGMLYLGHRYYYGQDVACDQAEGIRWYHRAAEAGSDAAMSRLAQIYEADKHYKEAARWYRRYAAERIRWRNQRLNW